MRFDPNNLPEIPKPVGMSILEQFAMHMHRKRKIEQLSQAELGALVGTSQAAIARIEKAQSNPSAELMQSIASNLNLECHIIVHPYVRPRSKP